MASTDQNMNDLVQAAKLKLETQKKYEDAGQGEDIYASMRAEINNPDFETAPPVINNNPAGYSPTESIQYQPEENYDEDYYVDTDDTQIFENGPGISQLDIWKKQYTKEKIFHTQILDKHFVFRTLNRFEYKQIVAIENIDALYREEIICSTCVLWPRNYDFKTMAAEDSGYPSTLAQIIMENSGFTKEYGIEVL